MGGRHGEKFSVSLKPGLTAEVRLWWNWGILVVRMSSELTGWSPLCLPHLRSQRCPHEGLFSSQSPPNSANCRLLFLMLGKKPSILCLKDPACPQLYLTPLSPSRLSMGTNHIGPLPSPGHPKPHLHCLPLPHP